MKITSVESATCVVPLDSGVAFATRSVQERHYTLVRIRSDSGVEGIGFSYTGHKAGAVTTIAIRELLADVVIGRDPHQIESIWDEMYKESILHGRRGSVLRGISAIDIALWDLISKDAGLPLYKMLGAFHEDIVPAYASGGYYQPGKTPEDLGNEMRSYLDLGLRAVKIKVGRVSTSEDVIRIGFAREAVGNSIPLFLDANNAWSDASSAIQACREFEVHSPDWIEEPLMPDDILGHAKISRSVNIPVATGEIHQTRWDFEQILNNDAADILQSDAGVCGGITEWRKIASMAAGRDVTVAPHWLADIHVHLVASTPNASWVEYFTDHSVLNIGRLFSTSLEIKDAGLKIPQNPGIGVEFDDKAVQKFSLDGWV